jgi:hypothetical protein
MSLYAALINSALKKRNQVFAGILWVRNIIYFAEDFVYGLITSNTKLLEISLPLRKKKKVARV